MATQSDPELQGTSDLIKSVSVSPSKRDSKYYKSRILEYLSAWGTNQYIGGVFEAPNLWSADIVGVKYSGRISEFEIKVSRADLLGEIKAVQKALEPDSVTATTKNWANVEMGFNIYKVTETTLSRTKVEKHHYYLTSPRNSFRPNNFYFAVPTDLVALAIEKTKGLKYGVFDADALRVAKRSQILHDDTHATKTYIDLLNRLSVMYRDISTGKHAIREDLLNKVAKEYNLEYGSVGWMRLMGVIKQYET